VRWFTAAAQDLLGTLLAQHTGIDAHPQQPPRWFREAAKRGDDAIRAANRVDLLTGWQGLEWAPRWQGAPAFLAPSRRTCSSARCRCNAC